MFHKDLGKTCTSEALVRAHVWFLTPFRFISVRGNDEFPALFLPDEPVPGVEPVELDNVSQRQRKDRTLAIDYHLEITVRNLQSEK